MPYYRRAAIPGGTYFFTVVTQGRQAILTHDDVRTALREAIDGCGLGCHSASTAGYCCRTICTPSGPCRAAMPISPTAGD